MTTSTVHTKPSDTTIVIRTCYDRGGHTYSHPFIGEFAIARKLAALLKKEFHVFMYTGSTIPDSFFERYTLLTVEKDSTDDEEGFVTSDQWYTYDSSRVWKTVDI